MLRQIRNALITAFVISLCVTSLSYAAAKQQEPLEVVMKAHVQSLEATQATEGKTTSSGDSR